MTTSVLTKAQRRALKMLYDRTPLMLVVNDKGRLVPVCTGDINPGISYREFRRFAWVSTSVGCLVVPWCGMTIGIESDGYTHS
jgi:hypothetical protein